jgi:hypothetical protein
MFEIERAASRKNMAILAPAALDLRLGARHAV